MAYRCECGNTEHFLEVFDTAIDVVDGRGRFVEIERRNVAHYICVGCQREIGYPAFWQRAAVTPL